MQVTLDAQRILHLIALLLSSFIIAKLLQVKLEWSPLSAWGLGISISCQVSNAILKIMDPDSSINNLDDNEKKWQEERKRELEKRKERRIKGNNDKKE
ncbi:hypothetical protein ACHAWT_009075 [Skeletonema menzelii]|mmetsp:Transcript_2077/g.3413  ORF Transcript_2077/g.3413 Transcript_2077/m.3413 type:complete len:98 (+) Transcript_2077:255-548(+)|eukprot:scaffold1446_cov145-Skeletonema_menzelii.AAC.12